jgi:hypothetical protein
MKKISAAQAFGNEIFKEQKLTIALDLGDLWPFYCVRDEAGTSFWNRNCRLHRKRGSRHFRGLG